MLINRDNLNTAFTGFNAAFKKGFDAYEASASRLAMTIPSNTSKEEYGWLGMIPKMREWVGDRVVNSLKVHGYTIKNRKFEDTIEVDRETFEDDQYGLFAPLFQEFGRSTAEHPDDLVYSLLLAGWSTLCYDGQYFFDVDHPVLDVNGAETSVANTDGGSGAPWFLIDSSRAMKPLIYQERVKPILTSLDNDNDENVFMKDKYVYGVRARSNAGFGLWQLAWGSKQALGAANYEVARQSLMKMKGDYGHELKLRPDLLIVGPSNEGAARRLLVNEFDAGGESNEWKGTAELLVIPQLG